MLLLSLGCNPQSAKKSELEQFWRDRPNSQNGLAVSGYERSFAEHASPALIDEIIADLCRQPSEERFKIYTLLVYYNRPRPATAAHLKALGQSGKPDEKQWAERSTRRLAELDAEADRHKLESTK